MLKETIGPKQLLLPANGYEKTGQISSLSCADHIDFLQKQRSIWLSPYSSGAKKRRRNAL